ncbi:MAG: hypothetical protein IJY74_04055, partial [Oscillospiraceae bacterium]|nr:hypothetical protein [Oscillospiraceae bacterium]
MRKNTFKKAISLLTASLMAAMCVPAFPVSAAESYAEPAQLITAADEAAAAFTFEASRNVIETGETLAVSIYDTATGDKWHGETLPDFEIGDDSVVSVSAGEETGTFIITGLSTGKTYVRFIGEGDNYADFCITVKQAPTGTTTAAAIISMSFEPSAPTLEVGETITVEMFSRMSDDPYSSNFPVYIISDPSIVSIAPGNDGSSFSLTGLSAGTTRIHFVPFEGTADMTVTVTESGDIMTETTTTTATTTTTIAECYATEVEYDSSPLPVAHVLPVRFYNPETGTATNAQFMEVSDNIDYEYEEGSDTVYIYTLAPGEAKMYILAEGCAFGAYVTFTVTDSGSQSTGTTSTSITTTTTAAYTTTLQQRLAFYFDAPKDTITVGEEMAVKLYSTFKAEYWSESELPEHYVNDPSIAAVEIGEEVGTFKITGLSAGSTFVRFIEEGYADFRITVAEDGTVTTTTTTA